MRLHIRPKARIRAQISHVRGTSIQDAALEMRSKMIKFYTHLCGGGESSFVGLRLCSSLVLLGVGTAMRKTSPSDGPPLDWHWSDGVYGSLNNTGLRVLVYKLCISCPPYQQSTITCKTPSTWIFPPSAAGDVVFCFSHSLGASPVFLFTFQVCWPFAFCSGLTTSQIPSHPQARRSSEVRW